MKHYWPYGEGAMLPEMGEKAKERAFRLWAMGLSTEADCLLWPRNRRLVVSWWALEAKMQERRA